MADCTLLSVLPPRQITRWHCWPLLLTPQPRNAVVIARLGVTSLGQMSLFPKFHHLQSQSYPLPSLCLWRYGPNHVAGESSHSPRPFHTDTGTRLAPSRSHARLWSVRTKSVSIQRVSRLTVPDIYRTAEGGWREGKLPRGLIGTVGDGPEGLCAGSPADSGNWAEPTVAFHRRNSLTWFTPVMHLLLVHEHTHKHIQKVCF